MTRGMRVIDPAVARAGADNDSEGFYPDKMVLGKTVGTLKITTPILNGFIVHLRQYPMNHCRLLGLPKRPDLKSAGN